MRINVAIPEPHVTAPVLNAALEGVTRLNQALLKKRQIPPFASVIDRVRWKPEPPGAEHFDHAGIVLGRGWGDCDDLAPWHAASLRATGKDRGARAIVKRSGPDKWHAVVRRSDGEIEDPSTAAGMPGRGMGTRPVLPLMPRASGINGAFDVMRPHLALRPVYDSQGQPEAWQARADLPWHYTPGKSPGDIALASLHASPVSDQAIVGACNGAIQYAAANRGALRGHDVQRIAAIRDACDGCSWEELAAMYGPEHATAAGAVVGSFFGSLKKFVKKAAKPLSKATKAVFPVQHFATKHWKQGAQLAPGGKLALQAYDMASPTLRRLMRTQKHRPPTQRGMPQGQKLYCMPFE